MYKIGIMTWFQYHNYGSALQAVALSETIKKVGYSPIIIKYYYSKVDPFDKKQKLQFFIYKLTNHIKYRDKKTYYSPKRENKFEEFLSNHLRFTDKCETLSELEALNSKFDCFVCGSDQIWGTAYFKPRYFLDFVHDDCKKIAYAPSIAIPKIDDKKVVKEVARLCSAFAYLSTREETGSKIIHNLTGRDVKTVLDPTLLLYGDDWNKLLDTSSEKPKFPYLIAYMLGYNEFHWKKTYEIAEKLNLNVRIIPAFQNDTERQGCITYPIGPSEFLSLIKNAAYVCTDSFHGMAFSVNFNKQFTAFERFKKHDSLNQNSRIYNLADKLDLSDRIFRKEADIKMIDSKIDYQRVNEARKALVDDSINYLKTALDSVTTCRSSEKTNFK